MNSDAQLGQTDLADALGNAEAAHILADMDAGTEPGKRVEQISKRLLGRPYVEGSLGGGPTLREVLTVSLDAFDCVTYIETVLALALSNTQIEFIETLRQIRYDAGEIDWHHRNHYMIDWARRNEARGFVDNITVGPETVEKTCELDLIAGLPAKKITFRHFPTHSLPNVEARFETGDLILFVSAKASLDVYHTGLIVTNEGPTLLRHATRTVGAVIEQSLNQFLSDNEGAGFIVLRPLCPR